MAKAVSNGYYGCSGVLGVCLWRWWGCIGVLVGCGMVLADVRLRWYMHIRTGPTGGPELDVRTMPVVDGGG